MPESCFRADSAVICVIRNSDRKGPLLLENIMFSPAVTWLMFSLREHGVERFFALCEPDLMERAAAVLPEGLTPHDTSLPETAAALRDFAAGAESPIITVTKPVWFARWKGVEPPRTEPQTDLGLYRVPPGTLAAGGLEALIQGEKFIPEDCTLLRHAGELRQFSAYAQREQTERAWADGAILPDGSTVYIDPGVEIGRGTALLPGTILRGKTVIGENCQIGPNAMLRDCIVGDGTTVNASQLNESTVGKNATVGPFAYVRPNSHIGDGVKVGDFVEIKNSVIGSGTKISHLTYVGDSDVGQRVNFGCGTVTVNYDGNKKYRTTIGDDCFIGCNTNLVAPVTVEDGAYTAAGSTVTEDVPADGLAVARARQVNRDGWAARHRAKREHP